MSVKNYSYYDALATQYVNTSREELVILQGVNEANIASMMTQIEEHKNGENVRSEEWLYAVKRALNTHLVKKTIIKSAILSKRTPEELSRRAYIDQLEAKLRFQNKLLMEFRLTYGLEACDNLTKSVVEKFPCMTRFYMEDNGEVAGQLND